MEPFPRRLVRRVENENFPLIALTAVREIREYLERVEEMAIRRARSLGASAEDIADVLGITRQGAYYKIRHLEEAEGEASQHPSVVVPELEPEDSGES